MEGFTRIDIFDTKGVEYIFVIGYLLILIVFWRIVMRKVKVRAGLQKAIGNLSANILRIPEGVLYNRNHTWTHLEESGSARIGLDDLLQHITGEVQFNHLRAPGELINKGDLLAELHQEGKCLKIASPISGKILDTNAELIDSPELLNEDPYKKGWIYKIKPSRWIAETKACYMAEEATNWSVNELQRFKDFLAGSAGKYCSEPSLVILQDGGELQDNMLSQLPSEVWEEFQKDFLSQAT